MATHTCTPRVHVTDSAYSALDPRAKRGPINRFRRFNSKLTRYIYNARPPKAARGNVRTYILNAGGGVNAPDLFRSAFNSALFPLLGVLQCAERDKETDRNGNHPHVHSPRHACSRGFTARNIAAIHHDFDRESSTPCSCSSAIQFRVSRTKKRNEGQEIGHGYSVLCLSLRLKRSLRGAVYARFKDIPRPSSFLT